MPDPPPRRPDDEDGPPAADPGWLLGGESLPAAPAPAPSGAVDSYEVAGAGPDDEPEAPAPARAPIAEAPRRRPRRDEIEAAPDPDEAVPQVWSRWAEWGPDLIRLAGVLLATGLLVWLVFRFENPGPGLFVLLVGLAAAVVLSYPLVITLERPVRVTPEQAVRDFYGSLAHHVPHYRRMWLLLSARGRVSGQFGSFEGFRAYWKRRLAELRGARTPASTPLVFEVEGFQSDRAADKSTAEATFTLAVSARGRRAEGPLATYPMRLTLVRGPDRQYYLDRGTLPDAASGA